MSKKKVTTGVAKVEHNIPIPPDGRKGVRRYPWNEMEVGDSIVVPTPGTVSAGVNWARRNKNSVKFISRKMRGGGVRVWRVK
ncbi:MAG TPA: hypothetical protein PKJ19_13575 [Flavobacteriales bacterium]|nr:hypothetical protein [Flavobacteriales bacterium]